jgi:RNA polymerase sigma factor (sigma-70 family)
MADRGPGAVLRRLHTLLGPPAGDATTDRQLLARFVARRDEAAFAELVRRHGPMVLGVCRRLSADAHAAEDAFQATFLVLARRAAAVPWRAALGGWLHGVARRVALKARARAGRRPDAAKLSAAAPADPAEEAARRELRRVVDQEVAGLPARYRAPLVLCDLEGRTHEEAARELGWAKGSMAKRLSGARQRLRVRLLRRGVGPEAGELAAAAPAGLAEAAARAAGGGASASAAALAKGVVRTMEWTKVLTAAAVLAAVAVGAGVGVVTYRAGANAAAAPAPRPDAPEEEEKSLPIDKAVIFHPATPKESEQLGGLPGDVVVDDGGGDIDIKGGPANVYAYRWNRARDQRLPFKAPASLYILAKGPQLDSPDEAAVARFTRRGGRLELEIRYTSAVLAGKELLRNVPWRPLAEVSVALPAGRYDLTVTWRAVQSLPDGKPYDVKPTVHTVAFTVREGAESKAEESLPTDKARIHHEDEKLPQGAAVAPVDLVKLDEMDRATIYRDALDRAAKGKPTFADGYLNLFAAGPTLNSPDKAAVVRLTRQGDLLQLEIAHTDAVATGAVLKKNIPWRPLAEVPVDLPPGRYRLTVIWHALKDVPDGKPIDDARKPVVQEAEFVVLEVRAESKAATVNGVEFRAYAPKECPTPAAGESQPVELGLRITNTTDKPLTFKMFDATWPTLKTADGKELKMSGGRDVTRPYPPLTVEAGKSADVPRPGRLEWPKGGPGLRLSGTDPSGFLWQFDGLRPGKYLLSFRYEYESDDGKAPPFWRGKATTEEIAFEILDGRNASKPVRVEGLEFTALTPARFTIPKPDETGDCDLGLRVANVSDKPLSLAVSDVLRPRLFTADGKEVSMNMGRDGLPRPLPPATLVPGESWTWRTEAKLSWTTDPRRGGLAELYLRGPDGRGVPGFWWFNGLQAGKYKWVVEYDTSKLSDTRLWVGAAKTEAVEFEIVGP